MTLQDALQSPDPLVGPSYNIYFYTDGIYKIVHFPSPRLLLDYSCKVDKRRKGGEKKLDASLSRSRRVVLELALCNSWDWFCTFTLDKEKYKRDDLPAWNDVFKQWIRDQRKKHGCSIRYVLIPELHKDGAWHMHGLFADTPPLVSFADLRSQGWYLPDKLVDGGYNCWLDYHKKFGFCSLGAIRSSVASAFYITKYVTKDQCAGIPVGAHSYYRSVPLARAVKHGEVYGDNEYLSGFCVNKYDFCETGMTHVADGLDWTFGLQFMRFAPLAAEDPGLLSELEAEFTYHDELVQLSLEGFV